MSENHHKSANIRTKFNTGQTTASEQLASQAKVCSRHPNNPTVVPNFIDWRIATKHLGPMGYRNPSGTRDNWPLLGCCLQVLDAFGVFLVKLSKRLTYKIDKKLCGTTQFLYFQGTISYHQLWWSDDRPSWAISTVATAGNHSSSRRLSTVNIYIYIWRYMIYLYITPYSWTDEHPL